METPINLSDRIEWKMTDKNRFEFFQSGALIGHFDKHYKGKSKGTPLLWQGKEYNLRAKGFWKNTFEIMDKNGNVLLLAKPRNWYSNVMDVYYENNKFELRIRNNPLSEWVILKEDQELLAYGLATSKNGVGLKLSGKLTHTPTLFHALLWYFSHPAIIEQSGDLVPLILLLSA